MRICKSSLAYSAIAQAAYWSVILAPFTSFGLFCNCGPGISGSMVGSSIRTSVPMGIGEPIMIVSLQRQKLKPANCSIYNPPENSYEMTIRDDSTTRFLPTDAVKKILSETPDTIMFSARTLSSEKTAISIVTSLDIGIRQKATLINSVRENIPYHWNDEGYAIELRYVGANQFPH